ncbi:MAG: DUF4339 domain-containing protein [Polyangiaceae bacterium]|nr:DUF4339 domain-containing protein [Polyangiaceae bacterium]
MTTRDEWRWTDERGVQRLVRTEELRSALANKVLPMSTLVWRPGMTEWAPASTMPELVEGAKAARPVEDLATVTHGRTGLSIPSTSLASPASPTSAGGGNTVRTDPKGAKGPVKTLMGLTSPNAGAQSARANGPNVPIIVPAAGGSLEGSRRKVITQPPAFVSGSVPPEAMPFT